MRKLQVAIMGLGLVASGVALADKDNKCPLSPDQHGVDWSKKNDFNKCDFHGFNFAGANLTHANLDHANLAGAILTGAILDHANLHHANLTGAILDGASCVDCQLDDATVVNASAIGTDFTKSNCEHTDFDGSNLSLANVTKVHSKHCTCVGTLETNMIGTLDCTGAATCSAPSAICGGVCINVTSDVKNCGACGNACSTPNAAAACVSSACAIGACNYGWADCDAQAVDGCETNVQSDVRNCGACGHSCSVANATATCFLGSCAVAACAPGFGDCDRVGTNGCESNLSGDNYNCGACGNVCPALNNGYTFCSASVCQAACNTGFQLVGGQCVQQLTCPCFDSAILENTFVQYQAQIALNDWHTALFNNPTSIFQTGGFSETQWSFYWDAGQNTPYAENWFGTFFTLQDKDTLGNVTAQRCGSQVSDHGVTQSLTGASVTSGQFSQCQDLLNAFLATHMYSWKVSTTTYP